MHRTILSIILTLSILGACAQERQKVYSLVKQRQETSWYETQAELWKEHLDKHPKDADGWLNYYTAYRMMKIYQLGPKQEDLDKVVKEVEEAIPGTFEYHYISYWNAGSEKHETHFHHLEKAHALQPDRPEVFDDFMTHYELARETDKSAEIAKQWFASNDQSPGLYAWSYNMLQSCDKNAILLTVGDNDTFPAWVLQYAKNVRTDIKVINTSLILVDEYRNKLFAELGIPSLEIDWKNATSMAEINQKVLHHIKDNTDRPIYFGISAQKHLYEPFEDSIYNVGMALSWCDNEFDNIAVMKRNHEKRFLLDYLKINMQQDISQGLVNHSNANYLVYMITLHNHYVESEDQKADELLAMIRQIAENANMSEQVEEVLKGRANLW